MNVKTVILVAAASCLGIAGADAKEEPRERREVPKIAVPQENSSTIISERQNSMRKMNRNLEAMAAVVLEPSANPAEFRKRLEEHMSAIRAISRSIPEMFPEGSGDIGTRAKSEIWEDREAFENKARVLNQELDAFAEAATRGDSEELRSIYKRFDIADLCNSCHEEFRAKRSDERK
jgi:cytochrome c556